MQRVARPQRGWRHWTGRILPVLGVALLALGPAHAKDKKKKHREAEAAVQAETPPQSPPPAPAEPPARIDPPVLIEQPGRNRAPALGMREPPRSSQNVALDRIVEQVQRRYKARVVGVDQKESGGRLIYVLKLLSNEKYWTVKVDAETGKEI